MHAVVKKRIAGAETVCRARSSRCCPADETRRAVLEDRHVISVLYKLPFVLV
jgi:hypothetical protein